MWKRTLAIAAVSGWMALGSAGTASAEDVADISACGHYEAVEAGRRALLEGDRESALTHFRAARELLRECERRAVSEGSARVAEPRGDGHEI